MTTTVSTRPHCSAIPRTTPHRRDAVGRPDFLLLIDTIHVVRAGNTAADLAAVEPVIVGYIQLSDNSLAQRGAI